MNKLLLLLSALSMAASQMHTLEMEICPVPVVVQPVVFIRKTPVLLHTEICEETILTLGSTVFPVAFVPTIVETAFEVVTTVTSTVTVSPEGQPGLQQPSTSSTSTEPRAHIRTTSTGESSLQSGFSSTGTSLSESNTAMTARSSSAETITPRTSGSSTGMVPSGTLSSGSSSTRQGSSGVSSPTTSSASSGTVSDLLSSTIQSLPGVPSSATSSTAQGPSDTVSSSATSTVTGPSGTTSAPVSFTDQTSPGATSSVSGSAEQESSGAPSSSVSSTGQGPSGPPSSTVSSRVATTNSSSPPAQTSQAQPSSTSSTEQNSTTTASLCIVTATAVPECCLNELPNGCKALEDTNGLTLKPVIPACEKAIGSYITDDMKECWQGEITVDSRGEYIADCLLYELEDCCITQLPQACKDLRGVSGSTVVDDADKCRYALGPFVHGIASPCLAEDNVTPETHGKSIVDCLEVAYGFRSGPVTITDADICPRTTSA